MARNRATVAVITILCVVAIFCLDPYGGYNGKAAAKKTQCLSNIKRLTAGMILYTQKNDSNSASEVRETRW